MLYSKKELKEILKNKGIKIPCRGELGFTRDLKKIEIFLIPNGVRKNYGNSLTLCTITMK